VSHTPPGVAVLAVLRTAVIVVALGQAALPASAAPQSPSPPATPVRLVFVHHSTGQNWLNHALRSQLNTNRYFVVDSDYGWGPEDSDLGGPIGDFTDIGYWYNWFSGPNRDTHLGALYVTANNDSLNVGVADPGGANTVVMFKSCFPNSALGGNPTDPPTTTDNPLRGQGAGSDAMTVANAKGIYVDLLGYFAARQDRLFIVVTAPPLLADSTNASQAANARAFNEWLVSNWLSTYPHHNVFVFDFYNVLTSNGGDADTNDLGATTGNHHRFINGAIQHVSNQGTNYSAYGVNGDSHPTSAGSEKAAAEFLPLLNVALHCWRGEGGCPGETPGPFTDPLLTQGVTPIRLVHVAELRTRCNAVRATWGLAPVVWTETLVAGQTPIRAVHIVELRTALQAAYVAASRTPPTYTDAVLTAGQTVMKTVHISELRNAVIALE
jgi:hypothetical protein